jgi:hypothetical protein
MLSEHRPLRGPTPEVIREAEEAHRETELTIGLGEAILERAREVGRGIEGRVREMTVPREYDQPV